MKQDIVANSLNQIMNAKKAGKKQVLLKDKSKLLVNLLDMMKQRGYIDYEAEKQEDTGIERIRVDILKLNACKAVKPRFYVKMDNIEKYLRRYLPSRNFGFLIISTNKGLLDQEQAYENKQGGALIAYFY